MADERKHWTPATSETHDPIRRRDYVPPDEEGMLAVLPLADFNRLLRNFDWISDQAHRALRETRTASEELEQKDAEIERTWTQVYLARRAAVGLGVVVVALLWRVFR